MCEKTKYSYEDKLDVINRELKKRTNQWHLSAVSWFDYDDVCQQIRIRIHNKWDQWNQDRPLEPWVNTIITNKIYNILRDNYSSFARPCINCKHNNSENSAGSGVEDSCDLTPSGEQCNECPEYAKWEKRRKKAFDVKIPVSINDHEHQNYTFPEDHLDIEEATEKLHKRMKEILTQRHYFIYKMIFIDGLSDSEVAKILGYKTNENGRSDGYKQLKNLKNDYRNKAKQIVDKEFF